MRLFAMVLLAVFPVQSAVLTGIVLDFESARPLARTLVTLQPIQTADSADPQTTRTESNGTFLFTAPPGVYTLTLVREGFAVYRYGAKCWNCAGAPIFLTGNERTAVDVRMHRLGALTGTIFDENQIGIPDIPVVVYAATRPMRPAGKVVTDDRGAFRVALVPGPYLVRTAAAQTKDGMTYIPSFYPEGVERRLARLIPIELERTSTNIDFPAIPGKLYRVQGHVSMAVPGSANSIDLISDSGREKVGLDSQGNFVFDRVFPGPYELFVEARDRGTCYAAWQPVTVDRDMDVVAQLTRCAMVIVDPNGAARKQLRDKNVQVTLRRRDLDQDGPPIPVKSFTTELPPGNYEITVNAGGSGYASEITVQGKPVPFRSAARFSSGYNVVQITISTLTASITGRVLDRPNETVPYAPVFLETLDLDPPDPPLIREGRTAADGTFTFGGLPPAKYRLLATFDIDPADRVAVEQANAPELTLRPGSSAVHDLSLYHK